MGDLSIPWKPNWELIYVLGRPFTGRRASGVLDYPAISGRGRKDEPRLHPFQKPVALIEALLRTLTPDRAICDPFMGAGTTAIAALRHGRRFVGIELDPKWFEVSVRRVREHLVAKAAA